MSVIIAAFILVTAPKPYQLLPFTKIGIFPHDISVYTAGELMIDCYNYH